MNQLILMKMVPVVGFEPTSLGLQPRAITRFAKRGMVHPSGLEPETLRSKRSMISNFTMSA